MHEKREMQSGFLAFIYRKHIFIMKIEAVFNSFEKAEMRDLENSLIFFFFRAKSMNASRVLLV